MPPSDGTYTFFSKRIFSEVDDVEDEVMLWMWIKLFTAQPLRTKAARTRLLQWDNMVGLVASATLCCFVVLLSSGDEVAEPQEFANL